MRTTPNAARERPSSVADGLILIGATAAGLALVRDWQEPRWCIYPFRIFANQGYSPAQQLRHSISVGISWSIPFAMALTLAMIAIRLRSPRPTFRRIARQPGAVACASALPAIAFRFGEEVYCWILGYLTRPQSLIHLPSPPFVRYDNPGFHPPAGQWFRNALLETFPILVSPSVSVSVAVGWCVLRASGGWRPNGGWIDRAGRWLGVYWIALGVVLAVFMELSKFIS